MIASTRQVYADCDHALSAWIAARVPSVGAPTTRRIFIPRWLPRAPEWQALSAVQRQVLLAILGHTDKNWGNARPALTELARETGLGVMPDGGEPSTATVLAAIKHLEQVKWIAVIHGGWVSPTRRETNSYRVTWPGEADRIRRAVEKAAKDGLGQRLDRRVEPDDVYYSNTRKSGEVRKAFIHDWEFASVEWQHLMKSSWALDCMIILRAHAVAGTVAMSKKALGKVIGRLAPGADGRNRVWETLRACAKLGVLRVSEPGGSQGHRANRYALCVPPSCARYAPYWQGSAPGAASLPYDVTNVGVVRFPGVRVAFQLTAQRELQVVGCPHCGRKLSDEGLVAEAHAEMRAASEAFEALQRRGLRGRKRGETDADLAKRADEFMRVAREEYVASLAEIEAGLVYISCGTVSCHGCGAVTPCSPDVSRRVADGQTEWDSDVTDEDVPTIRALDADQLVRTWLERQREPGSWDAAGRHWTDPPKAREPELGEVRLADRLVRQSGDWWIAKALVIEGWAQHADGARSLNELAQRAGWTDTAWRARRPDKPE